MYLIEQVKTVYPFQSCLWHLFFNTLKQFWQHIHRSVWTTCIYKKILILLNVLVKQRKIHSVWNNHYLLVWYIRNKCSVELSLDHDFIRLSDTVWCELTFLHDIMHINQNLVAIYIII